MNNPLISIIIPTYNRAHLIGETLDSVLAQTYTNWECIIVDDGSTDNTDEVLEKYCENDSRFQYHHRPNDKPKGANACRNYGFELSKGEHIQFIDSDDLISKNKLEAQVLLLEQNNGVIATCKWGRFENDLKDAVVKENQHYYKNFNSSKSIFDNFGKYGGYFPSHAYLTKREVILEAGLWDEKLIINQDGEFFCRVLLNSSSIIFAPSAVAYYRFNNGDNTSAFDSYEKNKAAIESWKMINSYILNRIGEDNSLFVQRAKEQMYIKTKLKHPELIDDNKLFFKRQIWKNSPAIAFYFKIINRVKSKF